MRLLAWLCCSVAAVASGSGRTEHAPRSRQPLLSPSSGRTLYLLTAVNPILAALSNDYSSRVQVPGSKTQKPEGIVSGVYRTLFYFARLKPRLMFSVGAALRALQMTTALQFVFDPPAGVGAGLNLLSLASASRWPAMLVLGWAASQGAWRLLGARPPPQSPVPITVSVLSDPETGKKQVIPISVAIDQFRGRLARGRRRADEDLSKGRGG